VARSCWDLIARLGAYAWAAPYTLVGLAVGLLAVALGARPQVMCGNLEIGGGLLGRWFAALPEPCRFSAITLGHVILATSREALSHVRAHECVHVRQYERWGILFVPAYLSSSLWQALRGRNPYRANRFEKEAYAKEAASKGP
jgi:hypothetical protein